MLGPYLCLGLTYAWGLLFPCQLDRDAYTKLHDGMRAL